MTETEKLESKITEYEAEAAQLAADIVIVEQQLSTATQTAEAAIAQAERRGADDATQATAVDAEQERQRLATALSRKRLALSAALDDLHGARAALVASRRAGELVELQTQLDRVQLVCAQIDTDPIDADLWGELAELATLANSAFYNSGGKARLLPAPADVRGKLFGAISGRIDWACGKRAAAPVPIPRLFDLVELLRARGLVRELLTDGG